MDTKVISIGYGEHLFTTGNVERLRMEACAKVAGEYHMVVFVRSKDLSQINHLSGLTIHPVAANLGLVKLWKAIILVRKLIRSSESKVIVTAQDPFETGLVGWLTTRFSKAELNVQEHGDAFSTKYWKEEKTSNTFRFYLGLFILRQADSVRVVSKRISSTLQSYGVKKAKIKSLAVITDPAPFTNVFPKPKVRSIFPVGSFILLTVARFVPQKNLRLMLKAFYQAQRQSPTLRLIIIGQGPDQKMIETIIEKNEGPDKKLVEVLPWTDDVPGFMASVDAYVLSSNYEGWGRVLIEALYANLPIVTTDVGCVGEVILDQEHALVVPINNETALTVALVELSTNPIKYQHIKNKMLSQSVPNNASYDSYANDWISTLR